MNSRAKGKRGELEVREPLANGLGINPDQICRNGQTSGDVCADNTVAPCPNLHVETKRRKAIAATQFMDQAVRDARPGQTPIVVMRQDRGEWLAMVRVADLTALAVQVATAQGCPIYPEDRHEPC